MALNSVAHRSRRQGLRAAANAAVLASALTRGPDGSAAACGGALGQSRPQTSEDISHERLHSHRGLSGQ